MAYVYIMANNHNTVLYIGVTNNLERRVWEHKNHFDPNTFASKYNCVKLVHLEEFGNVKDAIVREKQLKNWRREWKVGLIEENNPSWVDLAEVGDSESSLG